MKYTCPNCGVKLRGTSLAQHLAERCVLRRGGSSHRVEGAKEMSLLARTAEEPRTVRPCRWCKRPTLLAKAEVHERICSMRSLATPVTTTKALVVTPPPPRPAPLMKHRQRPVPVVEVMKRGSAKTVACWYCGREVPTALLGEHQARECTR